MRSIVVVFFVLVSFAKAGSAQPPLSASKKILKRMYIDITELDMASWLSYYSWLLKNEGLHSAQKVLPDSSLVPSVFWTYFNQENDVPNVDFVANYSMQQIGYGEKSKSKDYENFLYLPITGVTYEQAVQFCIWRTHVQGKGKFVYRLPTEVEWRNYVYSSLGELEQGNGFKDSLVSDCVCPTFNYKVEASFNQEGFPHEVLPAISFPPDKNKVYDLFGNVAEMLQEKGKAKGGSYLQYAHQCHIDSVQNYNGAAEWLGFRCVAVKLDKGDRAKKKSDKKYESAGSVRGRNKEFMDYRDSTLYPTVQIGDKEWFSENLRYDPPAGKFWVYPSSPTRSETLDYLYSWDVAKDVCPSGWRLPDKDDFQKLLQYYGDSAFSALRPNGKSGFDAFYCSLRYGINITPDDIAVAFWSATERNKRYVWGLGLWGRKSEAGIYSTYLKKSGLPVRCVRTVFEENKQ